ncbi:MAG TPA: hypothetical protein VM933_05955 [Acidimicrobiales bacterium]|nr:hypothetical protein [Acidimicrobiales bacterium]
MARGDETAYAANWATVLLVDALVGAAVAGGGLVLLLLAGRPGLGVVGIVAGAVYVTFVIRRFLRWRRLRADAGLPPLRSG